MKGSSFHLKGHIPGFHTLTGGLTREVEGFWLENLLYGLTCEAQFRNLFNVLTCYNGFIQDNTQYDIFHPSCRISQMPCTVI